MKKLKTIFEEEITLGSVKWEPYFEVYEKHFNKFVNKSPTVVEIGVQGGGSIQMWKKYFGEGSKIIGIDVDSNVLSHVPHYDKDVEIKIGDQGDPIFWDQFLTEVPKIDILIDDGGHMMHQQKTTFLKVFPHISDEGVFLCEDTHTCYDLNPVCNAGIYNSNNFLEFSKTMADILHYDFIDEREKHKIDQNLRQICKGLKSISFYNSIVVFEKEKEQPFNLVYANKKK